MIIRLNYNGITYQVDFSKPVNLSVTLGSVKCFYAPDVEMEPYHSGDFIGAVTAGAPVNFFNVKLNPHGNGTHTECIGHISKKVYSINQLLNRSHFISQVISVPVSKVGNDEVITLTDLKAGLGNKNRGDYPEALIIRTLPNTSDKLRKNYSGTNPPYFHKDCIEHIVNHGVKHLIVDLPSIDREDDGGAVEGHKAFWQFPGDSRLDCTITELVYVPDEIPDDIYLLNLQIAPLELDASPSKPVIFKMTETYD